MNSQPLSTVDLARMLIRDARSELNSSSRISADVDAELAACQRRLDEPLRVALAGTLKSGKSTLLNALVGEEIAPTDATECTRVVTWFSGSVGPRIELTHAGGRRCRCRKLRPRWSGCVVVFVEDAAESIMPLDVEVVESRAFGDRWW